MTLLTNIVRFCPLRTKYNRRSDIGTPENNTLFINLNYSLVYVYSNDYLLKA